MKPIKKILCFLFLGNFMSVIIQGQEVVAAVVFAQPPKMMSYQCIVRDSGGELVTKQNIGVRTTILKGTMIPMIIYQETYSPLPVTNENGLLSLEIGSGKPVTGDFSTINWSSGPYFLKTEIDPNGGSDYTITGQSQILSVPYAFYADKTGSYAETDPVWTGAAGNYYTKTNLQTSGQSSVHWNNLTNIDEDVLDLAEDGILTGSKVGTGICANSITWGVLPLARLSGITNEQLSATADIKSDQIKSLQAAKIAGISSGFIPLSNGTGLVKSSIYETGGQVRIGVGLPEALLQLRNYEGTQLKIGHGNQPSDEWFFNVDGSADLSLSNENKGNTVTVLFIDFRIEGSRLGIGTNTPYYRLQVGNPGDGSQARANAWNLLSDARLKKDFTKLTDPLAMLDKINGYYFHWNTGINQKREVGFSAQEVNEVLPEVVSEGGDGYLSIEYGKMAPLIVEALKELKAENEKLKTRIEKLEVEILTSQQ
ncbi:MAG TPA: tail fiber domain-containing protein [Bacteroidales bacterium]|mgnify:CR=1 FL=1|nr:tail fiber domain-containing protein [Bacteroidales bacterium]